MCDWMDVIRPLCCSVDEFKTLKLVEEQNQRLEKESMVRSNLQINNDHIDANLSYSRVVIYSGTGSGTVSLTKNFRVMQIGQIMAVACERMFYSVCSM